MEKFPYLSDKTEADGNLIRTTEAEYQDLKEFLGHNWFIKWKGKYHEVQLRMS